MHIREWGVFAERCVLGRSCQVGVLGQASYLLRLQTQKARGSGGLQGHTTNTHQMAGKVKAAPSCRSFPSPSELGKGNRVQGLWP